MRPRRCSAFCHQQITPMGENQGSIGDRQCRVQDRYKPAIMVVLAASVISKSGRGTCCKHHFLFGYGILFFSSGSELLGYGIDENTLA
ncbi:unnamed protein product [Sphagnum jensenii]|uniref:Uncharacterized protein n=1 Tax=Sphagnum jensenii TaxID=128206 RepID=A0ABP0WSD7_9BRYO